MADSPITALSPLDGRYKRHTEPLRQYFSEYGLIKYRLTVEVEWLIFLANTLKLPGTTKISQKNEKALRNIYLNFTSAGAKKVKDIEKTTNHDVKAVEYYLKDKLKPLGLTKLSEFIHFGCTSADVNSTAYALMMKDAINEEIAPYLKSLIKELRTLANQWKKVPMISRTHGQPASPTTVGKELINFVARLEMQYAQGFIVLSKMSGATGNFSAHTSAYPKVDWPKASARFLKSLKIIPNLYTAQIEPHDYMAEIFDLSRRINTILIDLDRDMWSYISFGYFKLKLKKGEVGSSTMPHKVNPIDFENSEGNLGLANAIFGHLSEKMPISRMQRDLSDSTVMRNIGTAFGHSLLGWKSTMKGLSKLELNKSRIKEDLDATWELLAEPIQTVMRKNRIPGAYEKLKELSRGKKVTKEGTKEFIKSLDIPASDKNLLLKLTPQKYIGLADKLVTAYLKEHKVK